VKRTDPWAKYAAGSEIDHFTEFAAEHLVQWVDEWDGQPLALEPFQRRMMGEALAYGEDGWPVWESVVIVMPRKNGKTLLLAAYALYRLLTWEGSPEILLTASSDKQAGRLFEACANFVRKSPLLTGLCRVRDFAGEIHRQDGGGQILRMSSDPGRLHGYNPSLVVCDELAQWTTPSLRRAYAALTSGGGARKAPQVFTITTAGDAHDRHESILGHILDMSAQDGEVEREPGLDVCRLWPAKMLVYNHEAPTTNPRDVAAMKKANPASWITEDYLGRQAANNELTDADVLQLHGCVWAEGETTFLAPDVLKACRDDERRLEDGETVVLAFDGSERRDETWLTACTLDGYVEPLARWFRPKGAPPEWRIPRQEVHGVLEAAVERFDVVEIAPDPPGWYSEIDEWIDLYGEIVVLFETKQPTRMAPACERTRTAALDGKFSYGGPHAGELAAHFGHCVARETPVGTTVGKDNTDSPRKIDGAVSAIIAFDRAAWHALNETPSWEPMVAAR
jgi:phage terminase large subunit-like protein